MRRFSCSATYQTPSLGMSWRDFLVDAPDMDAAVAKAQKRLARFTKVDIRVVDVTRFHKMETSP